MAKFPLHPITDTKSNIGYMKVTNDISELLDEGYFFVVAPIRNGKSEVVALTMDPITVAQADKVKPNTKEDK